MATQILIFEEKATPAKLVATGAVSYTTAATALAAGGGRRYYELGTNQELNDLLANNGSFSGLQWVGMSVCNFHGRSRVMISLETAPAPGGGFNLFGLFVRVRSFEQVRNTQGLSVGQSSTNFASIETGQTLAAYLAALTVQAVIAPGLAAVQPTGGTSIGLLDYKMHEDHGGLSRIVLAECGNGSQLLP